MLVLERSHMHEDEEFYMLWPVNKTDHMLQGINAMFISLYETICQNPLTCMTQWLKHAH